MQMQANLKYNRRGKVLSTIVDNFFETKENIKQKGKKELYLWNTLWKMWKIQEYKTKTKMLITHFYGSKMRKEDYFEG